MRWFFLFLLLASPAFAQQIGPGPQPVVGSTFTNPTMTTTSCATATQKWTSPGTGPLGGLTCNNNTGTLVFENDKPGNNIFSFRSNSPIGFSATAFLGVDPFYPQAIVTGSIAGTTMTVTGVQYGIPLAVGQYIYFSGLNASPTDSDGTWITAFGSGTGGVGTYTLSHAQTAAGGTTITSQKAFEHMALGWGNDSQPVDFLEASTFDGAGNPLVPPPEWDLFQTGGADPTGGTFATCTVTKDSTAITGCNANIGTNGSLIGSTTFNNFFGNTILPSVSGIQPETTLVSGGGTTSGVMSAPAMITHSIGLLFTNPAYAQYHVITMYPTGPVSFNSWDFTPILVVDRNGKNVGVKTTTTPLANFEVNGTALIDGSFTTKNVSAEACNDYATPTTGTTYTLPPGKCGAILEPAGPLAALTINMPANPVTGQIAWFSTTQAISSLTVLGNGNVIRANTTPTSLASGGHFEMTWNVNTVWYPR